MKGAVQVRQAHLALAGALVAVVNLWSLVRTPPPFVDDAWYANRAWALIETGRAFGSLDAGVFDRYEGYWTYIPWLHPWLLSLSIRALGLDLFSVRLVSLVLGLGLLVSLYAIGSHLGGAREGLVAVLLTALSSPFVYSSHVARPDVMVAAFGFGALALYVIDRGERLSIKSLLSGLAVAAAFEIHPNGMIYGPVIALLYLLDHGRRVLRVGRAWGFVAGLAGGLLLYAAMHVFPYPQTYLTLTRSVYAPWRTPPVASLDPGAWLRSFGQVLGLLFTASPLGFVLIVGAVVALARGRRRGQTRLLTLFAALVVAFAALVRHKLPYFAIELTPAAGLVVATFLVDLFHNGRRIAGERRGTRLAFSSLAALVVLLLLAGAALALLPMLDDPMPDYRAVVDLVRRTVPAGRSLMGSQTYWLGVPHQPYYSWENLVYYQRCVPGSRLTDALQAQRPDYLLIDRHLEAFIVEDEGELTEYTRFLYLPREELEGFLARQATLVARLESRSFGTVRIFRIGWKGGARGQGDT